MGVCNLSSGGVRANVRAGEDIAADRLFKYSSTENQVSLCGDGEEADGICLAAVLEDEILNSEGGQCYARKTSGVFSEVTIASNFTCGNEWMSSATGTVTAYSASGDKRPLGKFLSSGSTGETGKISFYAR